MLFVCQANSLGDILYICWQYYRQYYTSVNIFGMAVHLHHKCSYICIPIWSFVFVSLWMCAGVMRSVIYECLPAASERIISQSQSVMCTKRRQGERIHLPFSGSLSFSLASAQPSICVLFLLSFKFFLLSVCLGLLDIDDHVQNTDNSTWIKNVLTSQSSSLCCSMMQHLNFYLQMHFRLKNVTKGSWN